MKEYKLLVKSDKYDKKAVDELVEMLNEMKTIKDRYEELEEILRENAELKSYVWTTSIGEVKALHNIDDDHLRNILNHIVSNGGSISKEFKAEARKRGISIPKYRITDTYSSVTLLGINEGDNYE